MNNIFFFVEGGLSWCNTELIHPPPRFLSYENIGSTPTKRGFSFQLAILLLYILP